VDWRHGDRQSQPLCDQLRCDRGRQPALADWSCVGPCCACSTATIKKLNAHHLAVERLELAVERHPAAAKISNQLEQEGRQALISLCAAGRSAERTEFRAFEWVRLTPARSPTSIASPRPADLCLVLAELSRCRGLWPGLCSHCVAGAWTARPWWRLAGDAQPPHGLGRRALEVCSRQTHLRHEPLPEQLAVAERLACLTGFILRDSSSQQ